MATEFDIADLNNDEVISADEFFYYYYKELCFKFPVLRTGVNPGADLFNIFIKYCSTGKMVRCDDMASNQFAKLCRDSTLINDRVRKADIDIIFARSRAETEVLQAHRARPGSTYTTVSGPLSDPNRELQILGRGCSVFVFCALVLMVSSSPVVTMHVTGRVSNWVLRESVCVCKALCAPITPH